MRDDLRIKKQMLDETTMKNLQTKAENEALFSKIFESLTDFNLHFQLIAKEVSADIENYHRSQISKEEKISELYKLLEASEVVRSEAEERSKVCSHEKEQIESQLIEANEMLKLSEQAKVETNAKLQSLQSEMASAECKIEALLVSLDSSEKQKCENLQELKALIMEKESYAIKISELSSRVEQAEYFKRKAEITIQGFTAEDERSAERL